MKLPTRQRGGTVLPGLVGTARVERRTRALLPRLRPGDIAVVDHTDMDRGTAQSLLDAGVAAVVNAAPMISGRYPALGPVLLADGGVLLVDGIGPEGFAALRDGARVRLHDGVVHVGEQAVTSGRALEAADVRAEMDQARSGLASQLETLTHNSTEFLRREEDLLLHDRGLPRTATRLAGRPVVIVADGPEAAAELRLVRAFLREQQPVLIGVERGAELLRAAGHRPHVVVLDARTDEGARPAVKTLKAARDVVVRVDRGGERTVTEHLDRIGIRPLLFETGAMPEDAAVLLADAAEASVIIGVGLRATLEEFLDRQRPGLASTYLTRLKAGPRLVDAHAVPHLYSGRVRPRHLYLVMLAGLVALAAALAVTPVGGEWVDSLRTALTDLVHTLLVTLPVQGPLP
ncbi:putative cytokinetic ring protein SteA [Nocardioides panaciterrulae]|uniref:Putative membrane-anchored protein n=1 Tax=Nocardioides panaciterrulae TaxID=661492 RepID=A0A7Y9E6F6_9ACTN|nr:putative cytokinetic ring protein SteA [Nocardioides panaciterrulae]NYD42000.1 putative membrane-anchored protein [Nocardioides panaciterrulae]